MRIIFMGTPEFAVPSLEALYTAGHEIICVFTQPDKPQNRGMKLKFTPVKECALRHGTQVYQPEKLRDAAKLIRDYSPELIAVVAYGQILSEEILNIPEYGCVNVHASLLPKYRGAAPIQWAVINGENETGVTTMFMAKGLDTGDMIYKETTVISPEETSGMLHDRLCVMGADLLIRTIAAIKAGNAPRFSQNDAESSYAPMLKKEICPIDWNVSALAVKNKIRGLNPWPAAVTRLDGKNIKVFEAFIAGNSDGKPGDTAQSEKGIEVVCGDGFVICITELQAENGKRMKASDYLRGHPIIGGLS